MCWRRREYTFETIGTRNELAFYCLQETERPRNHNNKRCNYDYRCTTTDTNQRGLMSIYRYIWSGTQNCYILIIKVFFSISSLLSRQSASRSAGLLFYEEFLFWFLGRVLKNCTRSKIKKTTNKTAN
jgi:hypothetical protein